MKEFVIVVAVVTAILLIIAFCIGLTKSKTNGDSSSTTIRTNVDELEAQEFGEVGEQLVAQYLQGIVNTYGGYLYNDLCFESNDGHSSQIDHILITRGGLFVIETKSNKGTIYGDIDDDMWTCVKKEYQDDKRFKNPIKQNKGHINHLQRMFPPHFHPKMMSIIVFPLGDVSNVNCEYVYDLNTAINKIKELNISNKYSEDYVEKVNSRILYIQRIYSISKEKHIQNINKNYH